jgi:hypothetical protein
LREIFVREKVSEGVIPEVVSLFVRGMLRRRRGFVSKISNDAEE